MYDTIGLWYPNPSETHNFSYRPVAACLDSVYSDGVSPRTGFQVAKGTIDNMRVKTGPLGVHVQGSLARFYHGSNGEILTRRDTERAIQKLSDSLGVPFERARVNRLDIASNFIMRRPAREYLSRFLDCRYLKRSDFSDKETVTYHNGVRAFSGYDKIGEIKRKRQEIPEIFKGHNVLRLELSLRKRVAPQFKLDTVWGCDLYNPNFYVEALKRWHGAYCSVNKLRKGASLDLRGTKVFERSLAAYGLEAVGGYDVALAMLKSAKESGQIPRQTYYRLKKSVRDWARLREQGGDETDIIEELDKKVKQAVAFYR